MVQKLQLIFTTNVRMSNKNQISWTLAVAWLLVSWDLSENLHRTVQKQQRQKHPVSETKEENVQTGCYDRKAVVTRIITLYTTVSRKAFQNAQQFVLKP